MKILGLKINSGVYESSSYQMYVNSGNKNQQKEITKTYYIKDKKRRLERVRELLKNNNDTKLNVRVTHPKLEDWQSVGFSSIKEFIELQGESMFYGVWVEVVNKRALEIEVYVNDLYNEAETLLKRSEQETICFLIDKQYSEHKNIFDDIKSDLAFRPQYNQLIYDLLQLKINQIANIKVDDIRETLTAKTKKPLKWNAKKSSIGTLFGMLYDAKIIEGSKSDIVRSLGAMFSNLSESTLKDNVSIKENENEGKCYYDKETQTKVKDWISYLENSTTN